jgi:predicted RNase H-like nuclease
VKVIGVDLGWSSGATGLCAVEGDTVIDSTSRQSDDEIDAWIRKYGGPRGLVAFDAPLVVRNASSCRDCEWAISRVYHREEAGCHTSNTARAAFKDGGRAAKLAVQLGLAIAPTSDHFVAPGAGIEVYPHTAFVSLFKLPKTLKYKAKPGRSVDTRKAAFVAALALLESLRDRDPSLDVATSPRWRAIVEGLAGALRHTDLNALEDEMDAYMCAYVGLHYLRWRGQELCVVVGSGVDGYIVTPMEPERLVKLRTLVGAEHPRRRVPIS